MAGHVLSPYGFSIRDLNPPAFQPGGNSIVFPYNTSNKLVKFYYFLICPDYLLAFMHEGRLNPAEYKFIHKMLKARCPVIMEEYTVLEVRIPQNN